MLAYNFRTSVLTYCQRYQIEVISRTTIVGNIDTRNIFYEKVAQYAPYINSWRREASGY